MSGCAACCSRYARPRRIPAPPRATAGTPFEIGPGGGADVAGACRPRCSRRRTAGGGRGQAEVVEDELVVSHAAVARQQRLRPFSSPSAQWRPDRCPPAASVATARCPPVDVGRCRPAPAPRRDLAVLGTDPVAVALLAIVQARGPLVDTPAGRSMAGRAERQLERIQVCGGGIRDPGSARWRSIRATPSFATKRTPRSPSDGWPRPAMS